MEYTVNKLAKLAGISTRTLRYYDEIGLLNPIRVSSNGYRIYGQKEVDILQHILFYRELGVPLDEIKHILLSKNFDGLAALEKHLSGLNEKRDQLDTLITNIEKTIRAMRGESVMSDKEKFEGFVQNMIDDNEKKYGAEIRASYGDDAVDRSNAKFCGMSSDEYAGLEKLSAELNDTLRAAVETGDPAGETAQKACALHKKWLCYYWASYSKEAHRGVSQMYVDDERFTAYYDKIAKGSAVFLRDALMIFLSQ